MNTIDHRQIEAVVAELCKAHGVNYKAIEPLCWVIMNHWTRYQDFNYWKHRERLLLNPAPTTLVVKDAFEILQRNPKRFFTEKDSSECRSTDSSQPVPAAPLSVTDP